MMRIMCLLMSLGILSPAYGAVDNETMYLQCKGMLERKGTRNITPDQNMDSIECVSYVAGTRDSFNWSRTDPLNRCEFGKRTLEQTIKDYVAFSRRNGLLTEPAGLVFNQMFENCYCHDNERMEKITCFDRK